MVPFGYCPLARCLALMPWNRCRPLDRTLVPRTLFGPPTASAIIDGRDARPGRERSAPEGHQDLQGAFARPRHG